MEIPVLSTTQVQDYLKCGRFYYYKYLCPEIPDPPKTYYLLRGTAVHAALEHNYRFKVYHRQDMRLSQVLEIYEKELSFEKDSVDWLDSSYGEMLDLGTAVLGEYFDKIAPYTFPYPTDWSVEYPFLMPFPFTQNKINFSGVIDLLTNELILIDHKTKEKSPSKGEFSRSLQMQGYSYAVMRQIKENILGPIPRPLLESFRKKRKFSARVDCLVFGKNPKVVSEDVKFGVEDFESFLQTTYEVWKSIISGSFPPNRMAFYGHCDKYCSYYKYCSKNEYVTPRPKGE